MVHHQNHDTENLKRIGFSVTEANRIRMWERTMAEAIETLKMLKLYRTPQALRSFAGLFTILLPPLYSPAFAQVRTRFRNSNIHPLKCAVFLSMS